MRAISWGLLCCVFVAAALAAEETVPPAVPGFPQLLEPPVDAQLIAEHAAVPPGGTTRVAVMLDLKPGWHVYAPDPGDAGLPTTVQWHGPSDVQFGPVVWPAPETFLDPGDIETFGYHDRVILASTLSASTDVEEALVIDATVTWLACKEICIPGAARPRLLLRLAPEPQALSAEAQLFEPPEG